MKIIKSYLKTLKQQKKEKDWSITMPALANGSAASGVAMEAFDQATGHTRLRRRCTRCVVSPYRSCTARAQATSRMLFRVGKLKI